MDNLARNYQEVTIIHEHGVICRDNENSYTVETVSGSFEAKQAVSCLIRPLVGDTVLVTGNLMESIFILAVLEREENQKNTISFRGDVDFRVSDGRLTIASDEGMKFASPKDISLISSELNVNSIQAEVSIHQLLFSGGFWLGQVERMKVIASIFDSVIDRLTQKVKRSYRTIEDVDQLKAGRLDYVVKTLLSLRGKYSMVTAKEDVKIDGERIHMG